MQRLTEISLHGELGKVVGKTWKLAVSSVSEAIHAIETLSKRKLFKYLSENDKNGIEYRVLINGRDFQSEKRLRTDDVESIKNSELAISINDLKTIDIVPVLQGADGDVIQAVLGVILIIVGVIVAFFTLGAGLAIAVVGVGLLASGVIGILSKPPEFEDFREVKGGATSYLFNGPQNTAREGGPVPVGYGRLLVGSQVVSASYEISHRNADDNPLTK